MNERNDRTIRGSWARANPITYAACARYGYSPLFYSHNFAFHCVVRDVRRAMVARGGSRHDDTLGACAANRGIGSPGIRVVDLGFRCWRNR